jgi:hypothetical protein
MAMGIVSDKDFEKEVEKTDITPTHDSKAQIHIIERGRSKGNNEVPDSLRKVIGETAINDGRQEALTLAKNFGISASSTSAYTNGATSTSSYHDRVNGATIDLAKNKITAKAISKLKQALNHITPEKLENTKARELASVAKDMSAVIKNMEPEAPPEGTKSNSPTFVFYTPQFVKQESFEVIDAKDDF